MNKIKLLSLTLGCVLVLVTGASTGCGSLQVAAVPGALSSTRTSAAALITPSETITHTLVPLVLNKSSTPDDIIRAMMADVDRNRALANFKKITGVEPICVGQDCYTVRNRNSGSEGLQHVKDYIVSELSGLGYTIKLDPWSGEGKSDQNIIATKLGSAAPEEQVYFSAHMDGATPDSVNYYPAADDDASGVVDLLELAQIISTRAFSRTVVLFFSSGEEQGSLGANSYLDKLSTAELSAIKYAVNIEMIGYDADHDTVMQLFNGNKTTSMALTQIMYDLIKKYGLNLAPAQVPGCP